MKNFMVSRYASLEAYVPGEQPRDMEYVKLNTNENPALRAKAGFGLRFY